MSPRERAHADTLSGGSMAIVPPLAERQRPGLSATLTGPRAPNRCQSCAATHRPENPLGRWQEYDAWDRPQTPPVVVVLCRACSARMIEPHPRLYVALTRHEPYPGCMSICLDCTHRVGVACRSPAAKVNGGPGLTYAWADGRQPTQMHICSRGRHGSGCRVVTEWPGRVATCSGHAIAVPVLDTHPGDEVAL